MPFVAVPTMDPAVPPGTPRRRRPKNTTTTTVRDFGQRGRGAANPRRQHQARATTAGATRSER